MQSWCHHVKGIYFIHKTKHYLIHIIYNYKNRWKPLPDCEVDFAPPLDYQEPETPVVKDVMATKKVEEYQIALPGWSKFL